MTRYRDDRSQMDPYAQDRHRSMMQDREWGQRDWNRQDDRSQDRYAQDRSADDRGRDMGWDTSRMSPGMGGQDRWDDRSFSRDYGREGTGRGQRDDGPWASRPDAGPGYGYSGSSYSSSSGAQGDRSMGRMDDRGGDMRWRNLRWDADQQTWRGQDDYGRQDSRGGQGLSGMWGRQGQNSSDGPRGNSGWQGGQSAWGGGSTESYRTESYRGRGPKGYQRSDDRIKEMVSDALEDDDYLDASNIEVQVQGGEVTLTGTVNDRAQKRRAEDCVDNLRGVKDVHNQLRVQPNQQGMGSGTPSTGSMMGSGTTSTARTDTTPTVSGTAKS